MSLNNTLCLSSPAGHGDPEHRRVERENGGRAGEGGDGDGGRNDHGHLGHGAVQIHRRGRGQGQSVHTYLAFSTVSSQLNVLGSYFHQIARFTSELTSSPRQKPFIFLHRKTHL